MKSEFNPYRYILSHRFGVKKNDEQYRVVLISKDQQKKVQIANHEWRSSANQCIAGKDIRLG